MDLQKSEMMTFRHGGKIGDIIYSLPTIKAIGGGCIYIPENTPDGCSGMYSSLLKLIAQQPYIIGVREYPSGYGYLDRAPDIHIDIDLDKARLQPMKGVIHIIKRYMDAFGIKIDNWKEPWLIVDDVKPISGEYVVINFTNRHLLNDQTGQRSQVDWKKVYYTIPDRKYFVGTKEEHRFFCNTFTQIDYVETEDMREVARVVKNAKAVYCNQSSILSLSQSLGKEYYLAVKPGKTNCLLEISNEHLL